MHWRRCFDVMEFADTNLTKSLRGCRGRGRVSLLSGRFCDRQEKGPLSAGFFAPGFLASSSAICCSRVAGSSGKPRDMVTPPCGGTFHCRRFAR